MRFPGFTDEWKESTIGNVVKIGNGRDYKHLGKGDIPVFGTGGYMTAVNDYLYDGESVFIGRKGTIDKPSWYSGKFWAVDTLFYTFNFTSVLSTFLYGIFQRINWKLYNEASGVPSLSKATIEKIKIKYPSSAEQQKISHFLSLIDERIATQNKIIEDLKKLKSAIIDDLYSNVKGNSCNYSDLFTVVSERNSKRLYKKVIAASQEYGMVERDSLNLRIQFDEESINTYKIINSGDYVIHLRSFQGGFAFSRLHGICSPAYIILRPNERVEFSYFENFFTSTKFINSLRLVTYGIRDGRSINVEEWLSMKVVLPSNEEQRHIIQTIQSIQNKLSNENYILSGLESQRKYCLQNMFT